MKIDDYVPTCGCSSRRVVFAPRCTECGHRSELRGARYEPNKTRTLKPRIRYAIIEIVERIHARLLKDLEPIDGRYPAGEKETYQ
jgi:hypothetical protein